MLDVTRGIGPGSSLKERSELLTEDCGNNRPCLDGRVGSSAELEMADEGLREPCPFCNVHLAKARPKATLAETGSESPSDRARPRPPQPDRDSGTASPAETGHCAVVSSVCPSIVRA